MTGMPPVPKSVIAQEKKDMRIRKQQIQDALADKNLAQAVETVCNNMGCEPVKVHEGYPDLSWRFMLEDCDVTYQVLAMAHVVKDSSSR